MYINHLSQGAWGNIAFPKSSPHDSNVQSGLSTTDYSIWWAFQAKWVKRTRAQ